MDKSSTNLIECFSCKNMISRRAEKCPKCDTVCSIECMVCENRINPSSKECEHCGDPCPFGNKSEQLAFPAALLKYNYYVNNDWVKISSKEVFFDWLKEGKITPATLVHNWPFFDASVALGEFPDNQTIDFINQFTSERQREIINLVPCRSCNNETSERAETCPKCGSSTKTSNCLVCNLEIPNDSVTCPECGDPEPFGEASVNHRNEHPEKTMGHKDVQSISDVKKKYNMPTMDLMEHLSIVFDSKTNIYHVGAHKTSSFLEALLFADSKMAESDGDTKDFNKINDQELDCTHKDTVPNNVITENLMSVPDFAISIGVSEERVWVGMQDGQIKSERIKGEWYIVTTTTEEKTPKESVSGEYDQKEQLRKAHQSPTACSHSEKTHPGYNDKKNILPFKGIKIALILALFILLFGVPMNRQISDGKMMFEGYYSLLFDNTSRYVIDLKRLGVMFLVLVASVAVANLPKKDRK